jgi:hypothetical protein
MIPNTNQIFFNSLALLEVAKGVEGLYTKLTEADNKNKIVFFVEHGSSAEEALKKIKTFAPDNFINKKIVFVEHISGNHWQIQKKEVGNWDLTEIKVNGNGSCGIISAIVALREIGLMSDNEAETYIESDQRNAGKLKLKPNYEARSGQALLSSEQSNLLNALLPNFPDPNPDPNSIKNKVGELLKSTRDTNWLDSQDIKSILDDHNARSANRDVYICESSNLFSRDKDTQFEVSSFLLGFLNQKFQDPNLNKAESLKDILSLFGDDKDAISRRLGFDPQKKVDLFDIFPIDKDDTKAKVFYNENESEVKNFLENLDFNTLDKRQLQIVGLAIYQIDYLKSQQSGNFLGQINEISIKLGWIKSINDRLSPLEIVQLRNRRTTNMQDRTLARTLTRVPTRTRMPAPDEDPSLPAFAPLAHHQTPPPYHLAPSPAPPAHHQAPQNMNIFNDVKGVFAEFKNENIFPSQRSFISTCEFVEKEIYKDVDAEFLKSFADFFFCSLENFHAKKDNETTKSALELLKIINTKLGGPQTVEDYLEEDDPRKKHYKAQINNPVDQYAIKAPIQKAPNEDLKNFSLAILDKGDDYLKNLSTSLKTHFEQDKSFSEKMKTLSNCFNDTPLFATYSSSFSNLDSPLIPDFLKPIPDNSFLGWGRIIEIITTEDSKDFSLTLDGKEIKEIIFNGVNKLDEFKKLPREELVMEITNFFRTAPKDIKINYTNSNDIPEDLVISKKKPISFDKKNNKFTDSSIDGAKDFELLKGKLITLSRPSQAPASPMLLERLDSSRNGSERSDSPSFPHQFFHNIGSC